MTMQRSDEAVPDGPAKRWPNGRPIPGGGQSHPFRSPMHERIAERLRIEFDRILRWYDHQREVDVLAGWRSGLHAQVLINWSVANAHTRLDAPHTDALTRLDAALGTRDATTRHVLA